MDHKNYERRFNYWSYNEIFRRLFQFALKVFRRGERYSTTEIFRKTMDSKTVPTRKVIPMIPVRDGSFFTKQLIS
jgi:hypothetical protein